jgi:hypothetical protein
LPTDLIVQGKMTTGAASATNTANQVLRQSGMPDVGTRVTVTHNGRTVSGAVADAYTVNVAGHDSAGVKIKLDDGTTIEEPVDTLRDMGVHIAPEAKLPEGLPEGDLADPIVQQFADPRACRPRRVAAGVVAESGKRRESCQWQVRRDGPRPVARLAQGRR